MSAIGCVAESDDDVAACAIPAAAAGESLSIVSTRTPDSWTQLEVTNDAPRQRQCLAADAEPGAAHAALANQRDRHALGGVDAAIAKQMPCAGRITAVLTPITSPARIDQRTAGVARVERRVGLDDVVEQAAGLARIDRPSALTMPAVTVC